MDFSTLKKLRSCSSIYLTQQGTWNRCEHPLCWPCARHRANANAAKLRALTEEYPTLVTMTLSIASTPSTSLRDAWDALDEVRDDFTRGRWLTSRITAYRWHTELTRGPTGWHPHIASAVVFGNRPTAYEFATVRAQLLDRWSRLASARGAKAEPEKQHFDPILRTRRRAISYLTKGPMAATGDSRTAGRIFLDAAVDGDSEAAADWIEIEAASQGRRWQGTGGAFRRQAVRGEADSTKRDPKSRRDGLTEADISQ